MSKIVPYTDPYRMIVTLFDQGVSRTKDEQFPYLTTLMFHGDGEEERAIGTGIVTRRVIDCTFTGAPGASTLELLVGRKWRLTLELLPEGASE